MEVAGSFVPGGGGGARVRVRARARAGRSDRGGGPICQVRGGALRVVGPQVGRVRADAIDGMLAALTAVGSR